MNLEILIRDTLYSKHNSRNQGRPFVFLLRVSALCFSKAHQSINYNLKREIILARHRRVCTFTHPLLLELDIEISLLVKCFPPSTRLIYWGKLQKIPPNQLQFSNSLQDLFSIFFSQNSNTFGWVKNQVLKLIFGRVVMLPTN